MTDRSTYRVKGLPANISSRNVAKYLVEAIPNIGGLDNIRIRSVARSLGHIGTKITKTATFEFVAEPVYFRKSSIPEWTLSNHRTKEYLVIDKTFLGFTPLNDVAEADHTFDCIAISGLSSHPFTSWRYQERSGTHQHMWLRDRLPTDLPGTRVLLYGYETQLAGSESYKSIGTTSQELINRLEDIGLNLPSAKPLIVFAHGFGGIIVKRMITQLAYDRKTQPYLLENIKGMFQFGVPNKGMEAEHIINMVREHMNGNLVNDLNAHSDLAHLIDEESNKVLSHQGTRVISIYETKVTSIRQMEANGHWVRTGRSALLVNFESAISSLSDREKDVLGIDAKHFDLAKFAPGDDNYRTIRRFMKQIMHHHFTQRASKSSHKLQRRISDKPHNGHIQDMNQKPILPWAYNQSQQYLPERTQVLHNEHNPKRRSILLWTSNDSKHNISEYIQPANIEPNMKRRSILSWSNNDSKHNISENIQPANIEPNTKRRSILLWSNNDSKPNVVESIVPQNENGNVQGTENRDGNGNDEHKQKRKSILYPLINASKQNVVVEQTQTGDKQKKLRRKSFLSFPQSGNEQNASENKPSNGAEEKKQRRRSVMMLFGKA